MTVQPIVQQPRSRRLAIERACIAAVALAAAVVGVVCAVVIPLLTRTWGGVPVGLLLVCAAILVWRSSPPRTR